MVCDVKRRIGEMMKQPVDQLIVTCDDVTLANNKDRCLVGFVGDAEGQVSVQRVINFLIIFFCQILYQNPSNVFVCKIPLETGHNVIIIFGKILPVFVFLKVDILYRKFSIK
jgi:hypothetical protein